MIKIRNTYACHKRVPIENKIRTSFGVMHSRHAVFLLIENLPLSKLLFENPLPQVRLYGSGINSPIPWRLIDEHLEKGITLFKLKLGFGDEEDLKNLEELKSYLGNSADIAVDVNRGWSLEESLKWLNILEDFDVQWLEEPLTVEDEGKLQNLYERGVLNIAGGENLLIEPGCDIRPLAELPLDIFQPDITKYCPVHNAIKLFEILKTSGKKLFPHFLGSAPGQAFSFHLASGFGKDCLVEWDINRNPLRTDLFKEPFEIKDGIVSIPDRPGIGWNLDF